MKKNTILLFVLSVIIGVNNITAQFSSDKYLEAEDLVEDGNFHKALELYQEMLRLSPNNANLNFKIGFSYLNTATQKTKAIPFLEYASKHITDNYKSQNYEETKVPVEVLYYLGQAYHVNYRFDDAERTFYELKKQIPIEEKVFLEKIDHELGWCQYARLLMKTPVDMTVSNLGQQINSSYTEHSPVISGDESVLIYTSKREGNTGNSKTDDGQYFEDIYISKFENGKFQKSKSISKNINTPGHEASIGLSFDAKTLFIYRDDNNNGNIYVSNKEGDDWGIPEPLPSSINSKYRETHASMSFDKSEIYFTSDRKGGFGGLDIYRVRKLPNGNWSRAQNLGPDINTPYDEEGPYLHPDGTSLFFASQGHNSMGGFDIFISYNNEDEDKWMKPENIGYPINTPDDDIYYVPSVDGRRAYYASYANNSLGYYDIFKIDLSESHVRNQTVIAGIAATETGVMLIDGIVTISSMDDDLIGVYTPDQEQRRFLAILPRGKTYKALFESSNFDSFEKIIKVPEFAYDQSGKVVQFNDIVVGGKEPTEQMIVNIEDQNIESDSQPSTNETFAQNEKVYSFIGGDKRLAEANATDESYNAQSSYVDSHEGDNLEDKPGSENSLADVNSDEQINDGESEESYTDHATHTSKSHKGENQIVVVNKDSKSRIFYYLLGIIAVIGIGLFMVRRKSN